MHNIPRNLIITVVAASGHAARNGRGDLDRTSGRLHTNTVKEVIHDIPMVYVWWVGTLLFAAKDVEGNWWTDVF